MQAWLQNVALNWVANHQQLFIGLAAGAVVSHPATLAVLAFNAFVRIPGVGPWIARNPEKAKAWADCFDKAINACIDKYAKANSSAPSLPPATP